MNETINVLDHGYVRLLNVSGSDKSIVKHARTSTGLENEDRTDADDKKLLFYLYKNRHTSPFEMAKIWLEVQLPIFIWRQWARHRMQNMNEVSARYTELPKQFYIPNAWRKQAVVGNKQSSFVPLGDPWDPIITNYALCTESQTATEHVTGFCGLAYDLYEQLIASGIAREQARMVLPLNIYTKMHVCFDLHNLLHFIRLRADSHAQSEIQEYANAIGSLIADYFPWTWEAFNRYQVTVTDTGEKA